MKKLSQYGGWDSKLEERAREVLTLRFSELSDSFEFAVKGRGKGKACGDSYISAAYECRLDAGERKKLIGELGVKGEMRKKIELLNDEQLSRVVEAKRKKGFSAEQGLAASRAIDTLAGTATGSRKIGGDNLQDPAAAAKMAEFYANGKDKTYKAPYDYPPEIVEFVVERMKSEGTWTDAYKKLSIKGSPEASVKKEAWGDQPSDARAKAVLKSLMDNDFKDVLGNELAWTSAMQLDHRLAGSMGGKDTPDNWIWISAPTNQVKGDIEKNIKTKKLVGEEAERFLKESLLVKLEKNASMSADEVAKIKQQGRAYATEKVQRREALRVNLPAMAPDQVLRRIEEYTKPGLEDMLQASVKTGGPAFLKKSVRGQGDYPTVPQARAMLKMRWGFDLSPSDLRSIGQAIASSVYDTRPKAEILQLIIDRFGPTTGLTPAQRNAILDAAG